MAETGVIFENRTNKMIIFGQFQKNAKNGKNSKNRNFELAPTAKFYLRKNR